MSVFVWEGEGMSVEWIKGKRNGREGKGLGKGEGARVNVKGEGKVGAAMGWRGAKRS